MYHIKFKSKISYLGEKISILPWQMAEQLAVEVDVKNVTHGTRKTDVRNRTSSFICFEMKVPSTLHALLYDFLHPLQLPITQPFAKVGC